MKPQPSGGFVWVQAGAAPALVCRPLERAARHLFTTRPWRLGTPSPDADADGWTEVSAAMDVVTANLVRGRQVHGNAVVVGTAGDGQRDRPAGDIIITADASVAAAVQVADCVPLLIADPRSGAVAAAHAGWRGLAARVPQIAVEALAREFGSDAADLVAAIGPSIGACCYEVGADVRDAFTRSGYDDADLARWFVEQPQPTSANPSMPALSPSRRPGHWFMDGWKIARHQLELAGLASDRIHAAELCTASHAECFPSYRRDGAPAGRLAAAGNSANGRALSGIT